MTTPDHDALEKAYEAAAKALFVKTSSHHTPWEAMSSFVQEVYRLHSRIAISAFLSSLDGYKLMAREPTDAMLKATGHKDTLALRLMWRAMFRAAPDDITKKGTE
jgi:hypothetical protein